MCLMFINPFPDARVILRANGYTYCFPVAVDGTRSLEIYAEQRERLQSQGNVIQKNAMQICLKIIMNSTNRGRIVKSGSF